MPVHTGRLLLSTQDPFLLPDRTVLEAGLTSAGFLGEPLPGLEDAFLSGEQFLQLVTFAGCSVQIELSPAGDKPFCHIRFTGPFERPVLLSGRNTRPPRCPGCRTPLREWKPALAAWREGGTADITCPDCGETHPPWAWDWRQKAGFGRLFIQVEEIFPGEAVPTPGLTTLLQRLTGSEWGCFYVQDP
jgi:hypothetical protein